MGDNYKIPDTNIFLIDPIEAIYGFGPTSKDHDNYLIIPSTVLNELERFKDEHYTDRGYNAREFSREIKKIISESKQSINEPIKLRDNYFLQVLFESEPTPFSADKLNNDDYIIGIGKKLAKDKPNDEIELITNDNLMYLKASAIGLNVSDWESAKAVPDLKDIYKGWRSVRVQSEIIRNINSGILNINETNVSELENLMPNEYVLLIDQKLSSSYEVPDFKGGASNTTDFALARYVKNVPGLNEGGLTKVKTRDSKNSAVMGIESRNYEQSFALDALMNPDIKLVNLISPAGTGKTLLAVAAGLENLHTKYNKNGLFERLLITRIMTPSANENLGILPGEIKDKTDPWLMPIYDNFKPEMFEAFINKSTKSPKDRKDIKKSTNPLQFRDHLMEDGRLEIQPMSTLRGRSIDDVNFIVDESQNLTLAEVKTTITRAGNNTKLVLTGDQNQIDTKGLTDLINGLIHSSEKFKDQEVSATVYLTKGERSELATLGSKLL